MLRLHVSRGSVALAPHIALEEAGADYALNWLDFAQGDQTRPDYLAINPMGKVPAITHGDIAVTECAAICAYLGDAFPQAGLAPPVDGALRGPYYRWLFFGAGPVESATTNKMLQVSTEGHQQMAGYGDFDTTLQTLTQAVSQTSFICGETFTAADVYLGSQIGWGLQFGTIPVSPELEAYRDRVYARPAHARANALDDAAMAEHGPTMPNDA